MNTTKAVVCVRNRMFQKDCNTCWCNEDGTSYICTRKVCSEDVDEDTIQPEIKKTTTTTKAVVCVANRMFQKDCNTCWCNEDGTSYVCTRKVCVEIPDDDTFEDDASQNPNECRQGEVFAVGCNMCRCTADGTYYCTRKVCVGQSEEVKNDTLLRRVRASPQEPPKTCLPGTEFRLDCNKCLCDNEGQEFSCTRIDCAALNNNNNNGAARTKRDAPVKEVEGCTPGSVFDLKCNVCRCSADGGHAVCTSKPCEQPKVDDTTVEESNFRCSPGEQFVRECNDCTCSADGKSYFCTLRLCDDQISDELLGE